MTFGKSSEVRLIARVAQLLSLGGVAYAVVMAVVVWDDFPVAAVVNGVVWGLLSLTLWLVAKRLRRL